MNDFDKLVNDYGAACYEAGTYYEVNIPRDVEGCREAAYNKLMNAIIELKK